MAGTGGEPRQLPGREVHGTEEILEDSGHVWPGDTSPALALTPHCLLDLAQLSQSVN